MVRRLGARSRYRQDMANARKALEVAMDNYQKNEDDIISIGLALTSLKPR